MTENKRSEEFNWDAVAANCCSAYRVPPLTRRKSVKEQQEGWNCVQEETHPAYEQEVTQNRPNQGTLHDL